MIIFAAVLNFIHVCWEVASRGWRDFWSTKYPKGWNISMYRNTTLSVIYSLSDRCVSTVSHYSVSEKCYHH